MKRIIILLIGLILIGGCQQKEASDGVITIEVIGENSTRLCAINNGITFDGMCNQRWKFRLSGVNLKVNELYMKQNYGLKDGDTLLCKEINDSEYKECIPKMTQYNLNINKAELTYKNTTINCYFINDTYELINSNKEIPFELREMIEIERACTGYELQQSEQLIKGVQYCFRDGTPIICRLRY